MIENGRVVNRKGLIVLALQAKKDDPSNPGNKIAFTLDGHLCFVTEPEAAHTIIKQADAELEESAFEDWYYRRQRGLPVSNNRRYMEGALSSIVGRILAGRTDLSQIAKRA